MPSCTLCLGLMVGPHVGQSYVALSRAASLEGLQVLRFDPKKVRLSHGLHVLVCS